jgi:competence protein ComEA
MKIAKMILVSATSLLLGTGMFVTNAQTTTKSATMMAKIAPVNVNTASLKALETLPGIGPKIAAEIIKNRPYKNGKELQTKVKGIGPKVWQDIQKFVLFK